MRNIFITYLAVLLSSGLFIYVDKNYNFNTKSNNRKTVNTVVNNSTQESNPVAEEITETEAPVETNTVVLEPTVINQSPNQVLLNSSVEELSEVPGVVAEPEVYIVGMDETTHYDSPLDNTIHFSIDKEINSDSKVYLEYELYGLADYNSVCMSINDYTSQGGMVVCTNQEWTTQVQEIAPYQVQKGQNSIVLNLPESFQGQYKLRNFNVRVEKSKKQEQLVIRQNELRSYYGEYAYVSGFVNNYSKNVRIIANDIELDCYKGTFEGIIPVNSENEENTVLVEAYSGDELLESKTVSLENKFSYTYIQPVNREIDHVEILAEPNMDFSLELPGISLNAPAGFIENSVSISVTGLRSIDMPLPDVAMINVTGESDGFRCLPHGSVFNEDMEIAVKYDTAAIPYGYGPEDIRTFYYDEVFEKWVMLPYDTVDIANNMIISKTNHFTDFINAILKTPELPTNEAFTPTSLKDLDYANPLAGINIMSPPVANNSGTANLSFPIQVPAGRQGMQPNLAITYNSDGGSGNCGVGWEFNIPSITVDTRWGVPRYSSELETEEYLVNGQQIVELTNPDDLSSRLPVVHMGSEYRDRGTSAETYYSYRVEGRFDKIIRHGDSPDNYYWEVIDKNGVRYIYGINYYEVGSNPGPVVLKQPETDNIAKWLLTMVIDKHGNRIQYNYIESAFNGAIGYGGTQAYISSIFYTGFDTDYGKYKVEFEYTDKPDYDISARYGFLVVSDKLCKTIKTYYDNQLIRTYAFNYETGAYEKTILKSIADVTDESLIDQVTTNYDYNNPVQYSGATVHIFDYFTEEGISFEEDVVNVMETEEQEVGFFPTILTGIEAITDQTKQSLGRYKGQSFAFGGSICIGLGVNVKSKIQSFGFNYTHTRGNNTEVVQILDVNGDGLADKVVEDKVDGEFVVYFYKGVLDENGVFEIENEPSGQLNIPGLTQTYSRSNTFGGEILAGEEDAVSLSATYSRTKTKQITSRYFADINSDGFVDFIDDGNVYFNFPDENGFPQFTMEAASLLEYGNDECYSFNYSGSPLGKDDFVQDKNNPSRRDPVRMWVCPVGEHAKILYSISRTNANSSNNGTVYYSIQVFRQNTQLMEYLVGPEEDPISGGDLSEHTGEVPDFRLDKGDIVYFRLHSKNDLGFDDIEWDMTIYPADYYINGDDCDETINDLTPDGDPIYSYNYADDAVIHDPKYFQIPYDGQVNIEALLTSPPQSDKLTYVIEHWYLQGLVWLHTTIVQENPTHNTPLDYYSYTENINVNKGDIIMCKLSSVTNVNWSDIEFDATIDYNYYSINGNLYDDELAYHPSLILSLYPNILELPKQVTLTQGTYTVYPSFIEGFTSEEDDYEIVFTAKANHKLLGTTTIIIDDGNVLGALDNYVFDINILQPTENISFEYFIAEPEDVAENITYTEAKVYLDGSYVGVYRSGYYSQLSEEQLIFGNLYRGWGQFSYYDDDSDEFYLIDHDALNNVPTNITIDQAFFNNLNFSALDENSDIDLVEETFGTVNNLPTFEPNSFETMKADREKNRWVDNSYCAYTSASSIGSGAGAQQASENLANSTFSNNSGGEPSFDDYTTGGSRPTINKMSYLYNNTFTVGGGNDEANMGLTLTFTRTEGLADLKDMNGDRYPDIIDVDKIQYSTAYGGLSDDILEFESEIMTSLSRGNSYGTSMGMKGTKMLSADPGSNTSDNIIGSFGVGHNESNSGLEEILIDVNGDGLPDKLNVLNDNISVEYNLGYSFTEPQSFNLNTIISKTYSESFSSPLGAKINKAQFSFAFGIGGSINNSFSVRTITDINNDGLIDIIYTVPNYPDIATFTDNNLRALLNTGSSFIEVDLMPDFNNPISQTRSYNFSSNIAASVGFPLLQGKIVFSGYADINFSVSSDRLSLADVNGDGATDIVFENSNKIKARYGIPNKTNILQKVTTPGLSTYALDYTLTKPDIEDPNPKWTLSSLIVNDGSEHILDGPANAYYKFEYENGKYHRIERESFGYETVRTYQVDDFESNNVYRSTVEDYHTEDYIFKGLKKREIVYNSESAPYIETIYTWSKNDIVTGEIIPESEIECFGPYYPALFVEHKNFYEGNQTSEISTEKVYTYGQYGNITAYTNDNNIGNANDDVKAEITYIYNTELNLLSLVDELHVYNESAQLLRKSQGFYNDHGLLVEIVRFDDENQAKTALYYDQYGNVEKIEYPTDVNGDKLSYTYVYDDQVMTYPVSITDFWSNTMETTYDYRFGLPLIITDQTGNQMIYSYLPDGKLEKITGPNEVINGIPYTIKYEYWNQVNSGDDFWAMTRHYDPLIPNNEFLTVNISDGIGRTVQSKKTSVINGNYQVVVSGKVVYDEFGRSVSTGQPTVEAFDIDQMKQYSTINSVNPTISEFDVMDRPLTITAPDNSVISYVYGFDTDNFGINCFTTEITDQNGNISKVYKDARGIQTMYVAPYNTTTLFEYSAMGELIVSRDPENNPTIYKYDMFGRLTKRVHPDANRTSYTYDLAGNVLTIETENLNQAGEVIQYEYEDCRLKQISYPLNPEMNVFYEYGAAGTGNQSGRLVKQQDASGVQVFIYGNMGEVIENTHTYVVPSGDAYTFKTEWEYDSWNRLNQIKYPDGEIVKYHYDMGGKLYSMQGSKAGELFNYIDKTNYDKYGRRKHIKYGNGTISDYMYNDLTLRLDKLISKESTGLMMQNLEYGYDYVGNITTLSNGGEFVNHDFGGVYQYSFKYDNLYRLERSNGHFSSHGNGVMQYDLNLSYSPSGNIVEKNLTSLNLINGGTNTIHYNRKYNYNDRPHNVTNVTGKAFEWDLNGNMTRRVTKVSERNMCWDEENRLLSLHDSGDLHQISTYLYNAGGERVWKFTGPEVLMQINAQVVHSSALLQKTLYASPYMVMTETNYTKHYYIEGERICSKIGGGFGAADFAPTEQPLSFIYGNENSVANDLRRMVRNSIECCGFTGRFKIDDELAPAYDVTDNPEFLRYFYHPDHLGSSSFITNSDGRTEEHIQYLPYGEIFVQQHTKFDSRYKFTAKELDVETDLTYFGARYYDSDLSNWLSVDPLSDKYPSLSPYVYCANNPVVLVDPDGMSIDDGTEVDFNITNYVNSKGELLYKTDDGIEKTVVIKDYKLPLFESKLYDLKEKGMLNDAEANINELHILGTDIYDLKNEATENFSATATLIFKEGYEYGYKNQKNNIWRQLMYFGAGEPGDSRAYEAGIYRSGTSAGARDSKTGRINILNPEESLKKNDPLIKLYDYRLINLSNKKSTEHTQFPNP